MERVILGYRCVGVTTLVKELNKKNIPAVEMQEPLDPERIRSMQGALVQVFAAATMENVRVLQEAGLEFALVYPAMNCLEEYSLRFAKAGENLMSIMLRKKNWVDEIAQLSAVQCSVSICLPKWAYIPSQTTGVYDAKPVHKGNA